MRAPAAIFFWTAAAYAAACSVMSQTVFMVKKQLSLSEIVDILEKPEPGKVISVPPCKPKGGQIFLYKANQKGKEGKSYS